MAGIIDTVKLAGTLIFAIPAAIAGLEFLLVRGNTPVGVALLGLAVSLVLIQHYLTMPTDIPGLIVQRVVGSIAKEPDSESEPEPDRID